MWWQDAVVYQVYPRSFADGDGDGVGDLPGLRARLDHLAWLGVDAVWLSPIYRSPMADFGYDVADHCDVDPLFGTLADLDALVAEAHRRGLRVLLDWVPNHTSDQHEWFRTHPEYYVWRPGADGGEAPPNNWVRAFPYPPALPAWTRPPGREQWYLHLFLPEQPDLDWANPDVVAAMHDVLRFWLDRGVDGFRADVPHLIGKDPALPDDPPELATIPHCAVHEHPSTHDHFRGIRAVLDEYDDRVVVGELYLTGHDVSARVASYTGPDQLHLGFDFSTLFTPWGDAVRWRRRVEAVEAAFRDADGRWPSWFLSNHDNPRHRTRFGTDAAARAAAFLVLGLRGTPFLFQGEELGLQDAVVPPAEQVDPGDRDGCRAPIPWARAAPHGWDGSRPWLPFPPDAGARSVEAQRDDPASMLHLYRRLLAARRAAPALRSGALALVDAPDGVVAWSRGDGPDQRLVLVSMLDHDVDLGAGPWTGGTVAVASRGDGSEAGTAFTGTLGPEEAVLLR